MALSALGSLAGEESPRVFTGPGRVWPRAVVFGGRVEAPSLSELARVLVQRELAGVERRRREAVMGRRAARAEARRLEAELAKIERPMGAKKGA